MVTLRFTGLPVERFDMRKDVTGNSGKTDCSTAIKVLQLLRNTIEKEAGTAMARADNMDGVIRSQWIMKFNTLNEVIGLIDMTIKSIPTENPYEHCKNFSEVCQTLFETDPQMQKFFGKGCPSCLSSETPR